MFGITSAPELYQHIIQQVLQGSKGVCNISDDTFVHGRDEKEHEQHLQMVLQRLCDKGLTLNKDKWKLGISKNTFMGLVVSGKGIGLTEEKV